MIVGTFLAFDKHFNLVLSETEEFRRIKPKKAGITKRNGIILEFYEILI